MDSSLRESKKAATRRSLARAVVRQAGESGYHAVTAESVASEVGVSVRTFHNYFPNKDEALLFYMGMLIDQVFAAIRLRVNDGDTLWDSARESIMSMVESDEFPPADIATALGLMESEPSLITRIHLPKNGGAFNRRVDAAFAREAQRAGDEMYPRLVFSVAFTTARTVFDAWAYGSDGRVLRDTLGDAFDLVGAGFANDTEPIT